MKTIEEFRKFYDAELQPSLSTFEIRRKKVRNIVTGSAVAIFAIVGLLTAALADSLGENVIFVGIVAFAIMSLVWWLATRGFKKDFKQAVIAPIIRFCDPNLTYAPESGVPQGEFLNTGIFKQRVDRYRCEDLVSGRLDATALRFSEVHAEHKTDYTDSKGHRRTQWHTIFKGLLFVADFNKNFTGRTFVLPDNAERLMGFIGKKLQELFAHADQLVNLEDPEFEKLFVVYADDQVEARYILSTSLMSRITQFRKKTGRTIYLSFVSSNVNVAITLSKNLFEPRIFRTLLDFKMAAEYLEDLQLATGIVDELNLNTRIWTKRAITTEPPPMPSTTA